MGPTPLWGNFVAYADQDLLSFAYLYSGGIRVLGYYHATQAVEKYFKALALATIDSDGRTETTLAKLNGPWNQKLPDLAKICATTFPYYGEAEILKTLTRFSEFDQVAR
jgi:hypothetical protein